jgi:hypothetical protein
LRRSTIAEILPAAAASAYPSEVGTGSPTRHAPLNDF